MLETPPAKAPLPQSVERNEAPDRLTSQPATKPPAPRPAAREGKRGVAFWLAPEAYEQLATLGIRRRRKIQALMEEATDLLFREYGLNRIASKEKADV
jgi:hypothetical protein